MVTVADLKTETWYGREIVTDEMSAFAARLRTHFGVPASAVGMRGDASHLRGAHRSAEWIKNSRFCTDKTRSYTVQSGLTAAQSRHIAGVDLAPAGWGTDENHRLMREITQRVTDAMRRGELPQLIEWFGTLDNRTVYGLRNPDHARVTADSSHLEHGHGTIDRRHCQDAAFFDRLFAVITGTSGGNNMDFTQQDRNVAWATTSRTDALLSNAKTADFQIPGEKTPRSEPNRLREQLDRIEEAVKAVQTPAPAPVDVDQLAAQLLASPALVSAMREAVRAELDVTSWKAS